jgi:hypothetical protein
MNCTLTGQPMFYCSATGVLSLKNIVFCITVGSTGNSSIMQLPSGSPLISFDSCTFIPYSIVASNSYRSLSSNEKTVLSSSSYTPGFSSSQLSCYLFRVNSGSISFTSSFFSSFSFSSSLANYSIINFVAGKGLLLLLLLLFCMYIYVSLSLLMF